MNHAVQTVISFPAMRPGSCPLGRYGVAMLDVHGPCPKKAIDAQLPLGSKCPCGKCGKVLVGWVVDASLGHEHWSLCLTFRFPLEWN
jgi:hypothetical protein